MRIRVPGRIIAALAILAAFLCLLPASSKVAVARPIGWEDVGPPTPPPPGDNDGVVLKTGTPAAPGTTTLAAGKIGSVTTLRSDRYDFSGLRMFFAAMKLNYWLFWLR